MSSSGVHLENFVIPLKEILSATQNFSLKTRISSGAFRYVYKGQLKNRTVAIHRHDPFGFHGDATFRKELEIVSRFHHKNIIRFIGYCHEGNKMITVFKYPMNGSLDSHLQDPDKMRSLTWADRLKICLGAARGFECLHSGLGEDNIVIHRDVKSENILFDDNLNAKIYDFSLSLLLDRNQPQAYDPIDGREYYMDPIYEESGTPNTESDVYSFGVVLFEMLSGMLAN